MRLSPIIVLVTCVGLAVPSAAGATTLGQTCSPTNFSLTAFQESAPGVPSSVAPSKGVVTSFSVRGPSVSGIQQTRLKILRRQSPATNILVVADDALRPLATGLNVFAIRMPIEQGDIVGLGGTPGAAHCSTPAQSQNVMRFWGNAEPSPGSTLGWLSDPGYLVDLSVELEPDGDGDGYGDESQDQCASDKTSQAPCPAKDATAPAITDPSLTNSKFKVDKSGSIARKVPRGTTLRFTLSEPATVSATVERAVKGRIAKGKCKRGARKGMRCKLYRAAGSFSLAGAAGANQRPFSGRLKSGNLKKGAYRMTLIATDGAGNKSIAAGLNFKVVK